MEREEYRVVVVDGVVGVVVVVQLQRATVTRAWKGKSLPTLITLPCDGKVVMKQRPILRRLETETTGFYYVSSNLAVSITLQYVISRYSLENVAASAGRNIHTYIHLQLPTLVQVFCAKVRMFVPERLSTSGLLDPSRGASYVCVWTDTCESNRSSPGFVNTRD
jgi:hypothetical protein